MVSPAGILPPQFLLPSRSTRQLCRVIQRAYKSSTTNRPRRTAPSEKEASSSLYDELFPEERGPVPKPATATDRSWERLPPFEWAKDNQSSLESRISTHSEKVWLHSVPSSRSWTSQLNQTTNPKKRGKELEEIRRKASVLVLNCAGKSLEESDFFRLSPKGEHLEGWTSGIIKVIPGRDKTTLEPLGHYFILFSSDAAARAYLGQMLQLHHLARQYTRRSMASPLPPPPGYMKDGRDLHSLLRGFTLIPASEKEPSLRMLFPPFRPAINRMVKYGGPAELEAQHNESEHMVLFSTDKGNLLPSDISDAITADGRQRNLPWKLTGRDTAGIRRIDVSQSDEHPLYDEMADIDSSGRRIGFQTRWKYVISFKDGQEARRFVREWHRRPFPIPEERNEKDEPPPIINAEILW
ncbi:hypothetical protein F5884DRAFT_738673 [Xylogone sp. PMI_703]|nr:hypothetical protein F5884DRAFT_738673 [Xylogone sp. PMI_703]